MKVLITGIAGKLGHWVLQTLLERGHEVWGVDPQYYRGDLKPHRFEVADLTDRPSAYRVVDGAEVVIHLGEASGLFGRMPPSATYQFNTTITALLLEACGDCGVRKFLYASSCQVYGMCFPGGRISRVPPRWLPFDETHPVQPDNAYAASKVAGEMFAYQTHLRTGLAVAAFRFPMILPPDPTRYRTWTETPLETSDGPVCGFGTFVAQQDAALLLALAAENRRDGFEIYHANAVHAMLSSGVRAYIQHWFPNYPALPDDWPDDHTPMRSDKARAHFDWEPALNHPNQMAALA